MIGTEVASALRKSLLDRLLMAWPMLASPPSAIRRPGYLAWTAATARSAGATAVASVGGGAGDVNVTSALRPLAETRRLAARCSAASGCPPRLPAAGPARPPPAERPGASTGRSRTCRPGPRAWISTSSDGRGRDAELLQGLLGLPGLAGVVGGQVLAPSAWPGRENHGDQREPAEHARSCGAGRSTRRSARRAGRGYAHVGRGFPDWLAAILGCAAGSSWPLIRGFWWGCRCVALARELPLAGGGVFTGGTARCRRRFWP